jgi:hypothetical protein
MPNSTKMGWWLMGDILTAELWLGLHDYPASKLDDLDGIWGAA